MFNRVIFDNTISTDIARVNRADRTLFLNPAIWGRLTGLEREFVLLHEAGHLELMTASEYQANKYAVDRFITVQTLTDAELGKRIQVLTEITDPGKYISGNFFEGIGNAVGTIGTVSNETFKIFGIGAKNRKSEADNAAANSWINQRLSAKNNKTLIILGGVFLVAIVTIILILKKPK